MTTTTPRTETSQQAYADNTETQAPSRRSWSRQETAQRLAQLDETRKEGLSERDFETASDIPRSTFRHWDARRRRDGLSPAAANFFESPAGLGVLHQIVTAALFVTTLRGSDGIRLVCEFLELSGLADFVGSSFGSMQKLVAKMEQEVVDFGKQQRARLATEMAPKRITVCQDETFHPEICLVAMEAPSNFIFLEEYAERRDAATWTGAMERALKDLPVTVFQATGDEAKALKAHVQQALNAHHSPDVFHVQQTLSRSTSAPLASKVRQAKETLEAAMTSTEQAKADQAGHATFKHGPGRPPDFAGRIAKEQEAEKATREGLDGALAQQEAARQATRRVSESYHPYSLKDGTLQSPEAVAEKLNAAFMDIEGVATKAGLSNKSLAGIEKARRVTESMVETVRFTHREVAVRLAALDAPEGLRKEITDRLVPGLYLERVAARAGTAEERRTLNATAHSLLSPLRCSEHPFQAVPEEQRNVLEKVAQECADIFQRSSSCVEGRNGQLSLFHHGFHRLSGRKLAALTVIHNYYVTRPDGTTAAERFFGKCPDELFEYLLSRLPHPPRPAKNRAYRPWSSARRAAPSGTSTG